MFYALDTIYDILPRLQMYVTYKLLWSLEMNIIIKALIFYKDYKD